MAEAWYKEGITAYACKGRNVGLSDIDGPVLFLRLGSSS